MIVNVTHSKRSRANKFIKVGTGTLIAHKWLFYCLFMIAGAFLALSFLKAPPSLIWAVLTGDWGQREEFDDSPEAFPHLLQIPRWNPNCTDRGKQYEKRHTMNGFTVLLNYFKGYKDVACFNDITLAVQAEWTDLKYLPELANQYASPISLSVYAPGPDLDLAIKHLVKLRACYKSVRKFVSVHIYYPSDSMTKFGPWYWAYGHSWQYEPHNPEEKENQLKASLKFNCSSKEGLELPGNLTHRVGQVLKALKDTKQPRDDKGLLSHAYPVNLGRNIAVEVSTTYLVMVSNSLSLVPRPQYTQMKVVQVLKMAKDNYMDGRRPAVFVLPAFQVMDTSNGNNGTQSQHLDLPASRKDLRKFAKKLTVAEGPASKPRTDTQGTKGELTSNLVNLDGELQQETMMWLAQVPEYASDAQEAEADPAFLYFHSVRHLDKPNKKLETEMKNDFGHWEPHVYVAVANQLPTWDERLTWDSGRDNAQAMYEMCLRNFSFFVIKDSFAVAQMLETSQIGWKERVTLGDFSEDRQWREWKALLGTHEGKLFDSVAQRRLKTKFGLDPDTHESCDHILNS